MIHPQRQKLPSIFPFKRSSRCCAFPVNKPPPASPSSLHFVVHQTDHAQSAPHYSQAGPRLAFWCLFPRCLHPQLRKMQIKGITSCSQLLPVPDGGLTTLMGADVIRTRRWIHGEGLEHIRMCKQAKKRMPVSVCAMCEGRLVGGEMTEDTVGKTRTGGRLPLSLSFALSRPPTNGIRFEV